MLKFIIQWDTKVSGKWQKGYHQTIKENTNTQAMNVYVEHICLKKKEAKVFYDLEEADRVARFFANDFHMATVIKIR